MLRVPPDAPGKRLPMPPRATGFPTADAQNDFQRARRRSALARLSGRLRREPTDVGLILPYEEVVSALGYLGERRIGLRTVPLDPIVGTVDRTRDFDRGFRPTTTHARGRWEGIALAMRRGESFPPISLYQVGEIYFVRDGHHRVSVARALGRDVIDAHVTEVHTRVGADRRITVADLPMKGHERLFAERVPLSPAARSEIRLSDPWQLASLAEGVEAWGFRLMQHCDEHLSRDDIARLWFEDEYRPVVAMIREAGLVGWGTETEAYIRIVTERYRLLRTHAWSDEVLARLREAM
jgi:hypothetical protein